MFGGSEINKLPNKTEFYLQINHCFNSFRDLQGVWAMHFSPNCVSNFFI